MEKLHPGNAVSSLSLKKGHCPKEQVLVFPSISEYAENKLFISFFDVFHSVAWLITIYYYVMRLTQLALSVIRCKMLKHI
jgi:hypothetical protein